MNTIKRGALRLTMLGGLVAALAAIPGTGLAAAAPGDLVVERVSTAITIVPGATAVNDTVQVVKVGSIFRVSNTTGTLKATPGKGCTQVTATVVDCGTGVTGLSASLGGGNDTFTARVPLTGAVNGGDGSDVFNAGLSAGGGTTLTYQGGAGSTDMVSYAQANVGVFIRKDAVNNDGRNAGGNIDRDKVLGDVEIVVGSRFGDTIEGDNAPETINGLGGNDRLTANGGDDRIVAQDGGIDSVVSCGAGGGDIADADAADQPTGCETVNR
ncbi:calcium-binding protein [Planobispora longispora]|uniref:Uncharacterized protein n=1 Tax=Planobispora longispora TaxID=28887 RepID=A0A8J3RDJ7_9ACTN|nr:hypothetical protein [Planobispora longispora]GIH73747.1 hypothetical protein Plo01_01760 [Planobispora longispora]